MGWFTADDLERVGRILDELVPGVAALGGAAYVDGLLSALDHDPPRVWAGRDGWIGLGPWERHAWTQRIAGCREVYRRALDGTADESDRNVIHGHAVEAAYGDPVYGGNREKNGWVSIAFPQPLLPPRTEAQQ